MISHPSRVHSLFGTIVVYSLAPIVMLILGIVAAALLVWCYRRLARTYALDQGFIRQPTIRTWFVFTALFAVPLAWPSDQLFHLWPPNERMLARILYSIGSSLPLIMSLVVGMRCHLKLIVPFCLGMRFVWSLVVFILCCGGGDQPWTSVFMGTIWPEIMSVHVLSNVLELEGMNGLFLAMMAFFGVSLGFDFLYGQAGVLFAKTCRVRNSISWLKK